MYKELKIKQRLNSITHPQTNGLAEMTNHTILQGLKKRLYKAKGAWAEVILGLLLSYHTTSRSSTGETPFILTFGIEVLILLEIGIPSLRVSSNDEEKNSEHLRANLDLIDEVGYNTKLRLAFNQQRVTHYYNKQV